MADCDLCQLSHKVQALRLQLEPFQELLDTARERAILTACELKREEWNRSLVENYMRVMLRDVIKVQFEDFHYLPQSDFPGVHPDIDTYRVVCDSDKNKTTPSVPLFELRRTVDQRENPVRLVIDKEDSAVMVYWFQLK